MKKIPFVKELINEVLASLDPELNFKNILAFKENYLLVRGEKFLVKDKLHLFALGKAASFQLTAFKHLLDNEMNQIHLGEMVAYTKDKHLVNDSSLTQIEGSHPVISERNILNTEKFINLLTKIQPQDSLVFLLSGGGSSLMELPISGLSFADLKDKHEELLISGKNINTMNEERKKLSQVKSGGLLKFIKTKNILQFVTCDIPNEKIEDISSGPLMSANDSSHHPKTFMLNSASILLDTLCSGNNQRIRGRVYDCSLNEAMTDLLENLPGRNIYHFSGGEIPINVLNRNGKGGRNTHFVLAFAKRLFENEENRDLKILSIGTDGGDGPTDCAGAFIDYELFKHLDCNKYLEEYNSYAYFEKIGTLIKTGPTKTNVMDLRCIWRE